MNRPTRCAPRSSDPRPTVRRRRPLLLFVLSFLGVGFGATTALAQPTDYRLRFTPADPVISEGAGELVVDVSIVGCTDPADTVVWQVTAEGGSPPAALPGRDFGSPTPSEITLGQGSARQTVHLPVLQDDEPDPDEAVVVTLRAEGEAILTCAEGTLAPAGGGIASLDVLIEDDDVGTDVLPEVSVGSAYVTEGDAGVAQMRFPVRVSPPSRRTIRVHAATSDGSAVADEDYRPVSGLVEIPPGTEERVVRVPVIGDSAEEGNETFTLELSDPVNATLGTEVAQGVVEDDDEATAIVLEVVGSNDHHARPGEVVVLRVRARTDSGAAARAIDVAWSLSTDTDGALLDGPVTRTDASGVATQRVHAGSNPGVSSVVASDVGGHRRAVFTVTVGERLSRSGSLRQAARTLPGAED